MGEFLARPRMKNGVIDHHAAEKNPVRARLTGAGANATYDFYPTRELVEHEFHALWDAQQRFHQSQLTDTARDELHDILFFQRELRLQPVGKCTLDPSEERSRRALPSAQRLRIFQEINHLRLQPPGEAARKLTRVERDVLVKKSTGHSKTDVRFGSQGNKGSDRGPL